MRVPRLTGHNWQDPAAYKIAEEKEEDARRDPLARLVAWLQEQHGVPRRPHRGDARARPPPSPAPRPRPPGQRATTPAPDDALTHLFAPRPPDARHRRRSPTAPRLTMQQAIRQTLEDEMARDPTILVFGEDVGAFGGVHRVTDGLQTRFGEARVFDTSLNEEGIIGRSVGMALNGLRPVPEIQFRKYADPAHEQITDAGSLRWRTHGRFGGPMVLRIPVGYQLMGGDPWHAVCGEAVFAHLPGWQIAYPSTVPDAVGLLRTALRGDNPVMFLEHRLLYRYREANAPYPGPDYQVPFGKARLVREGRDAADRHLGRDASTAPAKPPTPWPPRATRPRSSTCAPSCRGTQEAVFAAVRRIGKVLIVARGHGTCGFGAELAAQIAEHAFGDLDGPVLRVDHGRHARRPTHKTLFDAVMPTTARVTAGLRELVRW